MAGTQDRAWVTESCCIAPWLRSDGQKRARNRCRVAKCVYIRQKFMPSLPDCACALKNYGYYTLHQASLMKLFVEVIVKNNYEERRVLGAIVTARLSNSQIPC